jgi:hypothetical protein
VERVFIFGLLKDWDQSKLIEIIRKKTDKAYSIDCGSCPECGELIIVEYSEED